MAMSRFSVLSVVRTEKNGHETTLLRRFLDDLEEPKIELAGLTFMVAKKEKDESGIRVTIAGTNYPALIGKGQSITFKLEEAP